LPYKVIACVNGLNGRDIIYAISDGMVYTSNIVQSLGNVGQVYIVAQRQWGCSKDAAFLWAVTLGVGAAVTGYQVYRVFRTQAAQAGARNIINSAFAACSNNYPVLPASSETIKDSTRNAPASPHGIEERRAFRAGEEATVVQMIEPERERAGGAGLGLVLPPPLTSRQRSGGGSSAYIARTAGDVDLGLPQTARRPRLHSTGYAYYAALGSSSADEVPVPAQIELPNVVPGGQ
jgi:hypothetical protein